MYSPTKPGGELMYSGIVSISTNGIRREQSAIHYLRNSTFALKNQ
jgi:hypothetical protein